VFVLQRFQWAHSRNIRIDMWSHWNTWYVSPERW